MNIIGQGLCGVAVADTKSSVKKFYKTRIDWEKEVTRLTFLAGIRKQGFDIGCTIPKLIDTSASGKWSVNDKTYNYCAKMDLVPGIRADAQFSSKELESLGISLGSVLFTMHTASKPYISQWVNGFGANDELLTHVLKEKAIKVLRQEVNKNILSKVREAKNYLEAKKALLKSQRSLSHIDLNLPNILVNRDGHVEGLVDWGAFGLTNPSLSMYQLATKPELWAHVKKQYTKLGGVIREDILYAAATIHLAWAPIICKELDFKLPEDETVEKFEEMYAYFTRSMS